MKTLRKATILMACASVLLLTFSCKNTGQKNVQDGNGDPSSISQTKSPAKIEAVVDGNTVTYGDHSYTVSGEISTPGSTPTAFVTFTNIPSGYKEFEAVYNALLGKSIQGTGAMIPMAIEIYARDREEGNKCFNLLCYSTATVNNITRILDTKLSPSQYSPQNDPYLQRYMAAALLKGANNKNAYSPDMPYTVEMCASPNGVHETQDGTVTYTYILADGWDTRQRGVEIFQAEGSPLYKVFNCPSCYTQCKNIKGEWQGLN